ncbi:MAG TPA: hypothetical protein VF756_01675 [Thermoanaerobaculia bacterium]
MKPRVPEIVSWAVLAVLLFAMLVGAFRFDRAGRPSLVGDEATYAMQAASLAWDLDLAYSRADYDRFVAHWGGPPDGLILQSHDNGARITYGKPFLYALAIAPFVRAAPVRGGLIANVVFLAAAAVLASFALRGTVGETAPLWVAAFLFASVSFGYAFWVHADLFLLAATAAGLALVYGSIPDQAMPQIYAEAPLTGPAFWRWFLAGMLLAVAGAFRPFYLILLIPALLAAWSLGHARRAALIGLVAGAVLLLAGTSLVQWGAGGSWSGYGGERQGFYPRTGYPEVDFPASQWSSSLQKWGNTSWLQEGGVAPSFDPKLLSWNSAYFFAGRNVGVLPYFLPLLLGFVTMRGDRGRWAIPLAVLVAVLGFLVIRPFNFYGGGGAIGNRYFLPLYPAFWFLAARPARPVWPVLAAALAAPFLWPLWTHPTAFPVGEDGRYRHVSEIAERYLPYETTQSHIPGGQDMSVNNLWLKLLNHNVYRAEGSESLRLIGSNLGELLVGSPDPLPAVYLDFGRDAPSRLEIGGAEIASTIFRPDGTITFHVPLKKPRAVHPMWWTWDDYYLYELDIQFPKAPAAPFSFRIHPAEDLIQRSGG